MRREFVRLLSAWTVPKLTNTSRDLCQCPATLSLFFLTLKRRRFAATTWFMPELEKMARTLRDQPSFCWIRPGLCGG